MLTRRSATIAWILEGCVVRVAPAALAGHRMRNMLNHMERDHEYVEHLPTPPYLSRFYLRARPAAIILARHSPR